MGSNRYLIRPEGSEWILEHNGEAIETLPSREAALEKARRHASVEDAEVVIVGEDGRMEDHERYGTRGGGDPVG